MKKGEPLRAHGPVWNSGQPGRRAYLTRLVTRIARLGSTALLLGGLQPARAGEDPPLWGNLGTLTYEVTTSNGLAQKYFDQGLRLTYAFNHAGGSRLPRRGLACGGRGLARRL